MIEHAVASKYDLDTGVIVDAPVTKRYLADLRGCFADRAAYEAALAQGNPLLYTVSGVEPAQGAGQMHYGLGMLMPGRIGHEYFLTKGHYHQWREAAEVYVGLRGEGLMLLEDEQSGESRLLPLRAHTTVYVPGNTAHRTINVGNQPLVYLGIYPSAAGHDYGAIGERNFRKVVIEQNGRPVILERTGLKP